MKTLMLIFLALDKAWLKNFKLGLKMDWLISVLPKIIGGDLYKKKMAGSKNITIGITFIKSKQKGGISGKILEGIASCIVLNENKLLSISRFDVSNIIYTIAKFQKVSIVIHIFLMKCFNNK